MAYIPRSIDTIFQELLTEKQTFTSLSGLLDKDITNTDTLLLAMSNGKAPEWVLWLYNMAVATHITEIGLQTAIDDIDSIIANSKVPVNKWYIEQAKAFQFGDVVVVDPVTYKVGYSVVNEANKIIGSATTLDSQNKLYIKVRKTDNTLLTTEELDAFTSYMQLVKAAGTQIAIENYDGDKFTLNIDLVYNGTYGITTIRANVEAAITDYLNNLGDDSKFLTNALVDKLQAVEGVIDPRITSTSVLDSLGATVNFSFEYVTGAGWGQINPSTPLSGTINYIPR